LARVLIVEDEAVLRLTFGHFLEEEGHEVHACADYDDAVRLLDQHTFSVIITDIILPGNTGVDLLRTVRERDLNCPVVMITGEPNVESAADAVRLGAFDYLPKPVNREALARVTRLAADRFTLADERDHFATGMDRYRRELEAIFNSVHEGIVTVDAEMVAGRANTAACGMLEIDPAIVPGRPFRELSPGQLGPACEALEQTLESRKGVVERRLELAKNGVDERILMVSTSPLMDSGGNFAGAVLVLRDVTRLVRLEQQIEETRQYRDMIGRSAVMQNLFSLIKDVAETDSTVLICGESGTGKELVADALHHASPRAGGPFVKVNCAALPESLLESELFGHVKGAFTGAVKDREGRFEAAHGGTILLDEIGDIPPRLQLRLLRVLQEREFERVGSSVSIKADVRVIACTNQRLDVKIQRGEFRQDLYYRLNVVRIDLPPLRDRAADIPLLADHFIKRFNRQLQKSIEGISPEALDILLDHAWPGNVRELENCIERAFIVCREGVILPHHLPEDLLSPLATTETFDDDQAESDRIHSVLKTTDWNVAKAARMLGVARNTLYQRMRSLNIRRPMG
jgi:two-component system, NtrC family, response regulator HydG